ncbi:E3 ubiquitin-protein ligase WAV3 [Camellia lanceoleosa]|uniref:E3 ubiquitin-protein ligase WAV3 n=1 Tax=Camellia lanceoleosa TaxID=1840588 RepID=A0ACC0GEV3_9ERIC|nr:E3 ubiquitin-protein ligase WAV3 [Camellia lanceoleosa]
MASAWNKLKKSLSLKLFRSESSQTSLQRSTNLLTDSSEPESRSSTVSSRSASLSISRLSRSISTRSSKKTCAICLAHLKTGEGQAIFTAECTHSFHFSCIANSVKHGNHLCPICRSKWKDIPFQFPTSLGDPRFNVSGRARVSPYRPLLEDVQPNIPHDHPLPSPPPPEPHHFSDDDTLPPTSTDPTFLGSSHSVTIKSFPEFPAISSSESVSSFAVLVGVQAPPLLGDARNLERAPIDLVTVLDVSGSMAGSKLALLKRALRFVIQNLGPCDRLAIVVFSSSARRIFPLRRMSEGRREDAVLAINSLVSSGGTNIVEGLKKGVRVLERRERNPVASIILLSDGRDTFNSESINRHRSPQNQNSRQAVEYLNLLPVSICVSPGVKIGFIPSGRYPSGMSNQGQQGLIKVGDLYADEEKEFLVNLSIPIVSAAEGEERPEKTSLLDIVCSYKDTVSKEMVLIEGERVEIRRPEVLSPMDLIPSLDVDRQRNRLWVAEGIAEAQEMAEMGNLEGAQAVLSNRRATLRSSASAQAGDGLCSWLETELREIRDRMASMELYEHTGRAYVLSGLSSHSWQRATTRGDSTTQTVVLSSEGGNTSSGPIGYDTPSMVNMVSKSQTLNFANAAEQAQQRLSRSCSASPR